MELTVQQWLNQSAGVSPMRPFDDEGDITIGFVRFDSEEEMFRLVMSPGSSATYDMEVGRISNCAGFMDFLFQIHGKPWVTAQHIKDLLDCVTCWCYRSSGKFPQQFFDIGKGMNQDVDY